MYDKTAPPFPVANLLVRLKVERMSGAYPTSDSKRRASESDESRVLLIVTGETKGDALAGMLEAVAQSDAELLDLRQSNISGFMTGHLLLGLADSGRTSSLLQDTLMRAKQLGLSADFRMLDSRAEEKDESGSDKPHCRFAVTLIADHLDVHALATAARVLSSHGAHVVACRKLSQSHMRSVEFLVSLPTDCQNEQDEVAGRMRKDLVAKAHPLGVDVAIQRESLLRRSKRLIVMDMDSTLIQIEVIDELARAGGVLEEVASITKEAMEGHLPFEESLRRRVKKLEGIPESAIENLARNLPLTEGAESLLRVLKTLGYKTGVISGGFTFATETLKKRLSLDYAFANDLVVKDGKLSGEVREPILGPERKAELLKEIAQSEGVPLAQTIAIGDGANDLAMLQAAGLGIAFHAKPTLKQAAHTSVSAGGLDRILYLLGFTHEEVTHLLEQSG